jgi:tRNA-splicing endonuclease subunit Sen2
MASSNTVNGTATQPQADNNRRPRPPRPNYRHIHRFPLPVTVQPLPPLIPHNPISVISVLLSYLTTYLVSPSEKKIYSAYFDAATSSVQVTDPRTVRALWEMGFFGKGTLSRSEPSWLEREKKRRGLLGLSTSEEATGERRVNRREMKLERARKEQEAIAQQLKEEAAKNSNSVVSQPLETLADPVDEHANGFLNGSANGEAVSSSEAASHLSNGTHNKIDQVEEKSSSPTKSVRFSPVVEEKKYIPESHGPTNGSVIRDSPTKVVQDDFVNEEHLQLANEEALFLAYGLGALQVFDQDTNSAIPTTSLIKLFTRHSTFPARPETDAIEPDDPFLVSYVVYHHFRSLGWVVRSGVKFGVDYILYNRGPAFAHAEFAILVLPSYENAYWESTPQLKEYSTQKESRGWWWLHGVNRVQAQVKKSLVLCFVDIPPPLASPSVDNIGETLRRYKVRDILIRRWVPNRSRD